MNALMIYPEWPDTYWSFKHALPFEGKRSVYPPLGLLTVSSLLPSGWKKRLVDTNIRALTEADLKWADVAMLSGMLIHKDELISILDRCRKRGLRTVIGGPVASSVPELAEHADHVVVGEAEDIVPGLAADLERGTAKPLYQAPERPGLGMTPLPDLSLINLKHYSAMAIQFSRGCPFNCEFCDIIEIYGRKPRTKSPQQVLAELEQLREYNWSRAVFIVDDNFIGNKPKVKEMLPILADWNNRLKQPFTFYTEASINLADDPQLLQLMQEARFTRVFLGIETPVEESLKEAQKYQNTRRSLLESVKLIQSYGMEVMAGFIVGFDNDPEEIFDKQVEFIQESAIPMAMVGLLSALPNTQLYRRLQKEGRLLETPSGDNMDLSLNFIPKMNPQRLVAGYRSILERIYHPDAYYERVRRYLAELPRAAAYHNPRAFSDYAALARSIVKQGLLGEFRLSYWKFFLEAATRYRHAFDRAITLAIMGHHFHTLTRILAESNPSPSLGEEVAAL
ncbi:MAG: B12-binding domain-containing radical SAM protein [Acidobacteria bacterium]|nr:B12-binding domain-containing radical SAM protein [Acidobacteriota bacterium]